MNITVRQEPSASFHNPPYSLIIAVTGLDAICSKRWGKMFKELRNNEETCGFWLAMPYTPCSRLSILEIDNEIMNMRIGFLSHITLQLRKVKGKVVPVLN
jgi:hypothetical protein